MQEKEVRVLETQTPTTQMTVGVTRCSRDLHYLWANDVYADWIRRPMSAIINRPISEVLGKYAFEALLPYFNRVLTGENVHYEKETDFQGIGPRWISADYTPTFDAEGIVNGWIAVVVDITESRRAEQALRESEERLRLAAEAGRMFAYSWDAVTDLIERSGESAEILGIAKSAAGTGAEVAAMVHPEHKKQFDAALANLTVENPNLRIAYRAIRPDGSIIWLERNSRAYFNEHGEIKRIIGMVVDITERKRAEEAVRESEQRFRLIADTAPVIIWMSDTDKLCTYVNKPWLDLTGRPMHSELGNGWVEGLHPEDLQSCVNTYTKSFDRREEFQMEYRVRRHDGEYRWILDTGVPRFNPDRSFAGYIGVAVDVTERKMAEDALSKMNQSLVQAHEEERTRIARELHDDISQRIALLAVRLSELQDDGPQSPTRLRRELEETIKEVQDLGTDVQSLSHRLHSSKLKEFGLDFAASGFCREFSEKSGVKIDFHSEEIPKDLSEEVSVCLFRVLQEAVQNAAKHSGSSHLQVSIRNGSNEIELKVRDSGIGFDPKMVLSKKGLGLTSMRERMKLINGELSIESGLQGGTTVCARVPHAIRMKPFKAG